MNSILIRNKAEYEKVIDNFRSILSDCNAKYDLTEMRDDSYEYGYEDVVENKYNIVIIWCNENGVMLSLVVYNEDGEVKAKCLLEKYNELSDFSLESLRSVCRYVEDYYDKTNSQRLISEWVCKNELDKIDTLNIYRICFEQDIEDTDGYFCQHDYVGELCKGCSPLYWLSKCREKLSDEVDCARRGEIGTVTDKEYLEDALNYLDYAVRMLKKS